ncbi:hypothetical protein OBV_14540 [Oscillibacter valericigenes Sjm18-20]|nr:hypothetical protein OBV_14540 [Oscillibacter valericigenes Sjm18-20]
MVSGDHRAGELLDIVQRNTTMLFFTDWNLSFLVYLPGASDAEAPPEAHQRCIT